MKRAARLLGVVLILSTVSAFGYTTATIVGRATHAGTPLSGVTVTVTSRAMQGSQSTTTDVNGRYAFLALPPGDYAVSFEFGGMQTALTKVRAGVGQTARADVSMVEGKSEAPAAAEAVAAAIETKGVQTNAQTSLIDLLPVGRDPASIVSLSPGSQGRAISGANQNSSLWMVDGALSVDPAFGTPFDIYIEDALQETTLFSAAIPAEFGRFSGGVVNTITLFGGDQFTGSFRDSFSNPSWTAPSPYQIIDNESQLEQTFEATAGGRIIRDQLWFFAAGRKFTDSIQQFYRRSPSWGYTTTSDDRRWQGKLTGRLAERHTITGSYTWMPTTQDNYCQRACAEPSTLDASRDVTRSLASVHYTGLLSDHLVAESFWGQTNVRFEGGGGDSTDQVFGTWGYDKRGAAFFGAPMFCGVCDPETREGTNYGVKGTWYLATSDLGTHTVGAGYDHWASDLLLNNYQSGSNFEIYTFSPQTYDLHLGDVFEPTIKPGDQIRWSPIPLLDRPSNQQSHGIFVNDGWDLGAHWSFNLGIRYDLNDIVDESGYKVSDTGTTEPRLAAVWDVRGNGRYRVNASYAHYTDRINNSIGSSAWAGGSPMSLYWEYGGPVIRGLPTFEAFKLVFDWFNAQCDPEGKCGVDNVNGLLHAGGGASGVTFGGSLDSPLVKEVSLGFSFAAGPKTYVRIDGVTRNWSRFIVRRVTQETGQTKDYYGNPVDVKVIENNDHGLERSYDAVMVQGGYRFGERWNFGGNYTWAQTKANAGFTAFFSPTPYSYPELTAFPQNNPVLEDTAQKFRAWVVYEWPARVGTFDFSVLESYDSGAPYSVAGDISTNFDMFARSHYANSPRSTSYFFSKRGAYHWDAATSTDIGLRYQFPLLGVGLFADVAVTNIFNESAQIGGDTYVSTRFDPSCRQTADPTKPCALFSPFTDTPVEGVHYVKSATFGQATSTSHYQSPRTYSLSAGVRF